MVEGELRDFEANLSSKYTQAPSVTRIARATSLSEGGKYFEFVLLYF